MQNNLSENQAGMFGGEIFRVSSNLRNVASTIERVVGAFQTTVGINAYASEDENQTFLNNV